MNCVASRPVQPVSRSLYICAALSLLPLAACNTDNGSSAAIVRDSAGVQIVENPAELGSQQFAWRLADEPSLDIGVLEGDSVYQLHEVSGAVRLSDGRIVVANPGSSELRFYGPDGRFLFSRGRRGGGPGEFDGLTWLRRLEGDSLLTYDWRNRRISFFDADGRFSHSANLEFLAELGGFPTYLAAFGDGSLLMIVQQMLLSGDLHSGLRRDTTTAVRCNRQGVIIDTLGRFPGGEVYVKTAEDRLMVGTRPFGRFPQAAALGDRFYFGTSDTYEIQEYSPSGDLVRLIRLDRQNAKVTAEDIARHKERELARAEEENRRQMAEQLLADAPFPETFPAYGQFLTDAEGRLWVADYRRPDDERPRWIVFDPGGHALGSIETPERFQIFELGPGYLLGRWADELDVEHVRLYELFEDRSPNPNPERGDNAS